MLNKSKSLILFLLATGIALIFAAFQAGDKKQITNKFASQIIDGDKSSCHQTEQGPVIDWHRDVKLNYADFKATSKGSPGFAVATTSSAFGYSITDRGGEISGSIYVRFYCEKSWWNPDFILDEVLEHEQLHFDICELFGRKLYKEVLELREEGKLNKRTIQRLQSKFEKQYSDYQDLYDKETDHSTKGDEQRKWNKKVKRELADLSDYSDYHSF